MGRDNASDPFQNDADMCVEGKLVGRRAIYEHWILLAHAYPIEAETLRVVANEFWILRRKHGNTG